jgi:hypothetical protein
VSVFDGARAVFASGAETGARGVGCRILFSAGYGKSVFARIRRVILRVGEIEIWRCALCTVPGRVPVTERGGRQARPRAGQT